MAVQQISALIAIRANFIAIPASLFGLMQGFIDKAQGDYDLRTNAISQLLAYHAASNNDQKRVALRTIEKVYKDATLLLGHMYGTFGAAGMPLNRPDFNAMNEITTAVKTARTNKGRVKLSGPGM